MLGKRMRFKFLWVLLGLIFLTGPAQAAEFYIPARLFYPGVAYTGDCTLKVPSPRCCTDYTGGTCNDTLCKTDAQCPAPGGDPAYGKCVVLQGDTGRRCCSSAVTPTDCQRYTTANTDDADALCTVDADCTGHTLCANSDDPYDCCTGVGAGSSCDTYSHCANRYHDGSELPLPKWECTDANSPKLFAERPVPDDMTSSTMACSVDFNTRSNASGKSVFFGMRAIAVNGLGHTAAFSRSVTSISKNTSRRPYWRAIAGPGAPCIEDGNTPGSCCSGNNCKGKIMKFELTLDSATTVTTPVRIRGLHCTYN